MWGFLSIPKPKSAEEKQKIKVDKKCKALLTTIDDEHHNLTVTEQVEAVLAFNKQFRAGKDKELEALVEKQIEISKAIKLLNSLV